MSLKVFLNEVGLPQLWGPEWFITNVHYRQAYFLTRLWWNIFTGWWINCLRCP